jgi:predicted enzyme related to lactoylglutathione lyase
MGNPVVFFEVAGPDAAALARFYEELFGWSTREVPGADYFLVDTNGGGGINGGVGKVDEGESYATFYVADADPQAVLDRATGMGARVAVPVTETPMVTYARFVDPDGLQVGIVKSAEPGADVPGPTAGEGAPVDWFEVLGSDASSTQEFYTGLFGWTVDNADFAGYALVSGAGEAGGGLGSGDEAQWATVYVKVPDVEAVLAKAESLGGRRVYGPNPVDDHMLTGALADVAGNVVGVYFHPDHE